MKAARAISPAKRFLRAQCSGLDEKQAKAWLDEYAPVVRILVSRQRKSLHYVNSLDVDDLVSVAQMAVLEACMKYNANAGGTLRTWVGNIVRWRLAAAIQCASDGTLLGVHSDVADNEAYVCGGNIEEQLDIRREFREYEALRAAGETDVEVLAESFEAGWTEEGVAALAEELRPQRRRRLAVVG
mgnify:CR=1 FL=1